VLKPPRPLVARRRDAVVYRMIATPPQPQKPIAPKRKSQPGSKRRRAVSKSVRG
jgi:hypothetical protein